MKIAIIGAGNVGGTLGTRWAALGYAVWFGVPSPGGAKLAPLRNLDRVVVTSPKDAVAQADVIALTVPWSAAESVIRDLGDLGTRIVIDCTNPVAVSREGVAMLPVAGPSAMALLANAAKGGRFVKTLNQVGFNIMADPTRAPSPALMLIAGDDAEAKDIAAGLVRELGFEARDAGPMRNAGALEGLAMLWIDQAFRGPLGRDFVLSIAPLRKA